MYLYIVINRNDHEGKMSKVPLNITVDKEVLEEFYEDGWEIRQPLDKPIGYYHCMKAHKLFHVPRQLNQGQCDILIRSGKFYPEKKKKYYVWHHDPEKGQVWKLK